MGECIFKSYHALELFDSLQINPNDFSEVVAAVCKICQNCVEHHLLLSLILKKGSVVSQCSICKSKDVVVLDCEDHDFQNMTKSLIRYYIDEIEYNSYFGGESVERVVEESDIFFSKIAKSNCDDFEEAILCMIGDTWEDPATGVGLFAGFVDGFRLPPFRAIIEGDTYLISEITNLAKTINYYKIQDQAEKLIDAVLPYVEVKQFFPKNLYRARIGYSHKYYSTIPMYSEAHYDPYRDEAIHAPKPIQASKGRMNRENVSFLYLASDEATAIAEVRPHPGHIVSVGSFGATKPLRLADFASANLVDFYSNEDLLYIFTQIVALNKLFSMPIPPNFQSRYIVTQLLSDLIRQKGFDGISFLSSVTSGLNFAFFDPNLFTYNNNSADVVQINSLEYLYKSASVYDFSSPDDYIDPDNY